MVLVLAGTSVVPLGCDESTGAPDAGDRSTDSGTATSDAGARDGGRVDGGASEDDAAVPSGCALPIAFDVGVAYERTLHVASDGTSDGDGTEANPFASLEPAARAATPGTRILIHDGTYDASWYLEDLVGEADRPIAIVGESRDGTILDANGAGEVLHVSSAAYVVLEGFTMRGSTGNGVNIDDGGTGDTSHHVVLRDLHVHDVGTGGNNDCVKLSGLDDFFVLDSVIGSCDAGDAIDQVGCHRGFLHGNRFEATPGGGIQMKGGSSDSLVHGNLFIDVAGRGINAGGSTGLEFFRPIDAPYEAARLVIAANVFVRSGASSGAPIAYVGCDQCVFANNTVIDPQTWVARILQESTDARFVPSRDGLFVNNLVVFDTSVLRTFVNVGGGTAPETFTFANDLWFATDDASFAGPTLTDGIPPETGAVIQVDPELADPDAEDFSIPASSPAATAGRPLSDFGATVPAADFDGRCFADPPAIGAFAPAP